MSDMPPPVSSFDNAPGASSPEPAQQYQPQPDYGGDNLGNGFLKNVDPRDRPVLEKYIKQWDQGVNARFREIHTQYQPYKELGVDPETLRTALYIYNMIDSDPRMVWQHLGSEYGFSGEGPVPNGTAGAAAAASPAVGQNGQVSAYDGLPEPFVTEFSQVRDLVAAIAQRFLDQEKQTKQQQEDQNLDNYLRKLHQDQGDFDDDWVLAKMYAGMDGNQAVQQYRAFVQNVLNQQASPGRHVPPILGGGGAVPNGRNPEEFSRGESKAMLADMLARASQAGQ